jgi:uncharacterized membrane protein
MSVRSRIHRLGVLVAGVSVLVLAVSCETPHDLGTFGGNQSVARAINEAGVAVGWADTIAGGPRAFTSPPDGPLRPLGSLAPSGDGGRSIGSAINDRGDVAGTRGGKGVVWWHDGTVTELPVPAVADPSVPTAVEPADINDDGIVVGSISLLYGEARIPFVWLPATGVLTRLDEPLVGGLGMGQAFAINEADQIVGQLYRAGGVNAVVWQPDGHGRWAPQDLPLLAGQTYGSAKAINDRGMIAGSSLAADFSSRAVVWQGPDHVVSEVPTPTGSAYGNGLNDAGVVVGSMSSTGNIWDPKPAAFKWKPGDARATQLLGLGGESSAANDINDAGVIVGSAKRKNRTDLLAVRWVDEGPPAPPAGPR